MTNSTITYTIKSLSIIYYNAMEMYNMQLVYKAILKIVAIKATNK